MKIKQLTEYSSLPTPDSATNAPNPTNPVLFIYLKASQELTLTSNKSFNT